MIDQKRNTEALLAKLETPTPPPTLRDRVLHRAGATLDLRITRDRWARIYASRPLRAAWVATVICLLLANVFLPRASRRPDRNWFMIEAAWRTPELRQAVTIPRLREGYASLDAFAYRQPIDRVPTQAGPHQKEKI
jgi:hypothetical protein